MWWHGTRIENVLHADERLRFSTDIIKCMWSYQHPHAQSVSSNRVISVPCLCGGIILCVSFRNNLCDCVCRQQNSNHAVLTPAIKKTILYSCDLRPQRVITVTFHDLLMYWLGCINPRNKSDIYVQIFLPLNIIITDLSKYHIGLLSVVAGLKQNPHRSSVNLQWKISPAYHSARLHTSPDKLHQSNGYDFSFG